MIYLGKMEEFFELQQKRMQERKAKEEEKGGSQSDLDTVLGSRSSATKSQHLSDSVGGSEEFQARPEQTAGDGELADETVLGSLLVLNCGHNGVLRFAELNQYEKHLITAGIIPR